MAGVGAGRAYANSRVEKAKRSAIDSALDQARCQVKSHAEIYSTNSVKTFLFRLSLKAAILGVLTVALLLVSPLEPFKGWAIIACLGAFLIWDTVTVMPTLRVLASHLRVSGFCPRAALGSAVAAHVFAGVLEQSEDLSLTRTQTLMLVAAGTNEKRFKSEVAEAVATLAGEASWQDLRPFLALAALKIISLLTVYSLYVWLILTLGS